MGTSSSRRFIPELHGLRGLSALWVMLYHTSPGGFGPIQFPAYGYLGVDVFFLLSGYVIMHTHGGAFATLDAGRIAHFLRLRWWRVYPLYAATLLLSIVVFRGRFGTWPTAEAILESTLLLECWALPGIGINGPSWSLGVEWIGYAGFPFLAWWVVRLGIAARLVLAAVALAAVAAAISRSGNGWNPTDADLSVIRMAAEFGTGCILASVGRELPGWHKRHADSITAGGLLGLYATLAAGFPHGAVACLAVMMFGIAGSGRWSGMVFGSRSALFLGEISFALYITHWILLGLMKHVFGQPADLAYRAAITVLFYALAIPFATLACRTIEVPARRWSRWRQAVEVR